MFSLYATNQYGDTLELTHNSAFAITDIDGFDPPDATINTEHNAAQDGAVFKSSYANSRQISITLAVNIPAEENRLALYKVFKSKFPVRLRYVTETRDVYADGYVQSMQVAYFQQKQTVQIVVQCPEAYLCGSSADIQEFATVSPLFEFPFAIAAAGIPFSAVAVDTERSLINNGDVETGALFTLRAIGSVTNPKLYNTGTGESMIFALSMSAGDQLVINTRQNQKRVTYTHGGVDTNAIGYLAAGSSWFKLAPGDNIFMVAADSGAANLIVTVDVVDLFEGV